MAVAANVGVVIGLVLIFVKVRKNAALTRTGMEQPKNGLFADIELSLGRPEMASVWLKSIRPPETLTDADIRRFESARYPPPKEVARRKLRIKLRLKARRASHSGPRKRKPGIDKRYYGVFDLIDHYPHEQNSTTKIDATLAFRDVQPQATSGISFSGGRPPE